MGLITFFQLAENRSSYPRRHDVTIFASLAFHSEFEMGGTIPVAMQF